MRAKALEMGFDTVGFAPPTPPVNHEKLETWLNSGGYGDMDWMARNRDRRADPRQLMAGLSTIMVVGVNYQPAPELLNALNEPHIGYISAYARHKDYHDILKKRLKALARWLEAHLGGPQDGRVFVDTAPVLERPLAAQSGLGWQGKNSMLVSRQHGCWLFLGELFLALPLAPDPVEPDHCGQCDRCQKACPTGALDQPYWLLAPDCLAYWSIETDLPIPQGMRQAMGNRVYGCDDCLIVCPFNRFGTPTQEPLFLPKPELENPDLLMLAQLDETQFRTLFSQSPVKRTGRIRVQRNVAVALGNWGSEEACDMLKQLFMHEHALVRGHAAWGLGQCGEQGQAALEQAQKEEADPYVQEEIQAVLAQG
ncbi:tRNA epoxyqueuosine(34) reductase QueG [Magnetococcus sp. PR-3]|uniref:tRNA epoxyqueuosine(34) reductase QueG n=1 Tax=Magnetococcus sp. PR-3 TaxID=3120355 RepID=UPI002FCE13E8